MWTRRRQLRQFPTFPTTTICTGRAARALTENAGLLLTGGTTGAVQDAAYQTFLDKIEPYSFNAVGCDTKNSTVKGLFANWTRRLRDEQGVKFQCVLHGYLRQTMRA